MREATQDQTIKLIKQAGCSIVLDVESVKSDISRGNDSSEPMRNGTADKDEKRK